ncbi:insulinase family protein, partial [Singulisphaera acidiphila]
ERDSAEARAHRGLLRALYPPDHAYRLPIDGEEAIVARLTRDDVRRFHEQFHGPNRAACIVAGDVDPAEVARALDDRLSGWSGPEVSPLTLASPARG